MTKRKRVEMAALVAANLLRLRKKAALTQEELAEKCHLSRASVAQIEGARYASARTRTLETLSTALGCEISEFFRGAA